VAARQRSSWALRRTYPFEKKKKGPGRFAIFARYRRTPTAAKKESSRSFSRSTSIRTWWPHLKERTFFSFLFFSLSLFFFWTICPESGRAVAGSRFYPSGAAGGACRPPSLGGHLREIDPDTPGHKGRRSRGLPRGADRVGAHRIEGGAGERLPRGGTRSQAIVTLVQRGARHPAEEAGRGRKKTSNLERRRTDRADLPGRDISLTMETSSFVCILGVKGDAAVSFGRIGGSFISNVRTGRISWRPVESQQGFDAKTSSSPGLGPRQPRGRAV